MMFAVHFLLSFWSQHLRKRYILFVTNVRCVGGSSYRIALGLPEELFMTQRRVSLILYQRCVNIIFFFFAWMPVTGFDHNCHLENRRRKTSRNWFFSKWKFRCDALFSEVVHRPHAHLEGGALMREPSVCEQLLDVAPGADVPMACSHPTTLSAGASVPTHYYVQCGM